MRTWPLPLGAMCLPASRNGRGPQGLRPIAAKPSTGWRHRMVLSAAKSPFPIRNRCRSMREKRKARAMLPGRTTEHPWRVPVVQIVQTEVPETGLHVDLVADEKVRADIAMLAGLTALPRFDASFDVTLHGRKGLHVIGRVSAIVGQTCGVTLEPIENEID